MTNNSCFDESSRNKWVRPILRIIFLLILLPIIVTYFHFRRITTQKELCFLTPFTAPTWSSSATTSTIETDFNTRDDTSSSSLPSQSLVDRLYGAYAPKSNDWNVFETVKPIQSNRGGWPSAHMVARDLSPSGLPIGVEVSRKSQLGYDNQKNAWCVRTVLYSDEAMVLKVCSDAVNAPEDGPTKEQKKQKVRLFPPSGVWNDSTLIRNDSETGIKLSLRVSCPPSAKHDTARQTTKKRKQNRRNKNLDQILNRPATTILLSTNIYLAFRYWNDRINPSSVGKIYNKIVPSPPHELWRAYTGAFAHFELLHIGFNMMNLYSLGEALEEGYGSIPFLYYNLSLVVFTAACMMFLFYCRIRMGHVGVGETVTVGYSGVLFAWMVITTMRLKSTCPVPFLPDVCFDTHTLGPFKFNISPLVQLVIAQMIMPRVSFLGHLSGILCGFLVYWKVIPIQLVAPQLLIPAVLLGHLYFVQKSIPIKRTISTDEEYEMVNIIAEDNSIESGAESPSAEQHPPSRKRAQRARTQKLLQLQLKGIIIITLVSVIAFDFTMTMSQIVSATLFYIAMKSYKQSTETDRVGTASTGTILRYYFLSLMLVTPSDAMSVASWFAMHSFLQINQSYFISIVLASCVVLVRMVVNIGGAILATKLLADLGELNGGVFGALFGWVLSNAKMIGDWILAPIFNPFEGRGVTLGGGGVIPVGTMRSG